MMLYVSPRGDDAHPGTKKRPLATLAAARDAVRRARRKGGVRNVTVRFAGGTYCLAETVVFTTADSAPRGCKTTYAAAPGARPVFSAGVAVGPWRKLAQVPKSLPARARGKVYVADLPDGVDRFYTLFDGATRLPRARCKGFSPVGKAANWTNQDHQLIRFPAGKLRNWPNPADVELCIVPSAPWTMNILPLASVDTRRRRARTALWGTYGLTKPRFGKFQSGSVFVENVFEGMTAPGTWVLDSAERKVYLWPRGAKPSARIVAPVLTELVRVEGRIDDDGPRDTPARGIVFRGLTFTHADRYTWPADHIGGGLQHDWEIFDAPSAMVRFRGAEQCGIEHCRMANAGATAIRLDLHAKDNRVVANNIEHVGGAGVLLAGYGPGTKDVNKRNIVTDNHIHRVGETYWHSAGIFAWQSGENRIAHNHVHNVPYTAIVASGRIIWDPSGRGECSRTVRWKELRKVLGCKLRGLPWDRRERFLHARKNIIERNDIHDVMEMLEDGNGVYVSGCGGGNVVRFNYIHHCQSIHMAEGIRCDDDQHETVLHGNVLFRIGGLATYIAIKGVNHVTNNIMACPVTSTLRGLLSLEHTPLNGSRVQRNIFYANRRSQTAVGQGFTYYKTITRLSDCDADRNVYFNSADAGWGRRHLKREQALGIEAHSIAADPLFRDAEGGDFRLRSNSPALKLGFRPIDLTRIGPRRKPGPSGA